jgi:catechol 2,3-dioxygenase-like lactoylglutathione lyase family enzyme
MNAVQEQVRALSEIRAPAPDVIRPSKFAHCVIKTSKYKEVTDWYKTVLNATATHEGPRASFLTWDEEHHRVAIVGIPDLPLKERGRSGYDHVAFAYASLTEMLTLWERLKGKGIHPYWAVNHGPTCSLYYMDPDQNKIELQVDNYETIEELFAYFATPEYAENTTGVDFDPGDVLRRLRAGEPEASFQIRPRIGPRDPKTVPTGYEQFD